MSESAHQISLCSPAGSVRKPSADERLTAASVADARVSDPANAIVSVGELHVDLDAQQLADGRPASNLRVLRREQQQASEYGFGRRRHGARDAVTGRGRRPPARDKKQRCRRPRLRASRLPLPDTRDHEAAQPPLHARARMRIDRRVGRRPTRSRSGDRVRSAGRAPLVRRRSIHNGRLEPMMKAMAPSLDRLPGVVGRAAPSAFTRIGEARQMAAGPVRA